MSAIRGGADFRRPDKREVGSVNRSKRLCPCCVSAHFPGARAGLPGFINTVSARGARVDHGSMEPGANRND
jgi:hypothetical protein